MEIGISTASLFTRKETEDALPLFNEWKIPCSEVFLTSFCEYKPEFGELLKARVGESKPFSVHVLNTQFEPQLYNISERVKADAYSYLGQAMTVAKEIGATRYTFHGIARIKRGYRENIPVTGKKTAEIFEFCQKFGVTLCYENVEWAFYNRPGIFRGLKEYCPGLKGVLDIKQARISGYPYREYLEEMGENISHVHVSDIGEDGKMRLPGKGIFDFDELFRRLKDVGFDGPLFIENYQSDYCELSELKQSYEFLAELAQKY